MQGFDGYGEEEVEAAAGVVEGEKSAGWEILGDQEQELCGKMLQICRWQAHRVNLYTCENSLE